MSMRWMAMLCVTLLLSLPMQAQGKTVTYIHTDALGSPVLETNQAGQVVRRVDYRAYGEEVLDGPQEGPGYTGHYRDTGTGLVYMQQRYYDPAIGRFLSVDPVGVVLESGANFNRYKYGENNPYGYVDPDGMRETCVGSRLGCPNGPGGNSTRLSNESVSDFQPAGVIGRASTNASVESGCTDPECNEYRNMQRQMLRDAVEALGDAGEHAAKESAWFLGGGVALKAFRNVLRSVGIFRNEVKFGANSNQVYHAFRHTDRAGLNRRDVQRVVRSDLRSVAGQVRAGEPYNRTVFVGGKRVTYTAYRLEDGVINVGRITVPR